MFLTNSLRTILRSIFSTIAKDSDFRRRRSFAIRTRAKNDARFDANERARRKRTFDDGANSNSRIEFSFRTKRFGDATTKTSKNDRNESTRFERPISERIDSAIPVFARKREDSRTNRRISTRFDERFENETFRARDAKRSNSEFEVDASKTSFERRFSKNDESRIERRSRSQLVFARTTRCSTRRVNVRNRAVREISSNENRTIIVVLIEVYRERRFRRRKRFEFDDSNRKFRFTRELRNPVWTKRELTR